MSRFTWRAGRSIVCSSLTLVVWATSARAADTKLPYPVPVQRAIAAAVAHDLKAYGARTPVPGVVVGIWQPGRADYVRGIGFADLARHRAMNPVDRFRVGSNTKTFVITVLLQLADEGKLHLDDSLARFTLGVHVPNGTHVTLREIAQMRSGIVDLYALPALQKSNPVPYKPVDRRHWVQVALDQPPLFKPGTAYRYSNTNYMLLGMVIESVTHDTLEHQIGSRLIAPLGLHATTFPRSDPRLPLPYAHGYMAAVNTAAWTDETVALPPSITWAAGAMISNLPDMQRWVKLYVLGKTNSAATQRQRLRCLPTGDGNLRFGLGIGCSGGWYGYTGGITGYNTGAYYLPGKDATIVAFVNSQRGLPGKPDVASAIVRDLARLLFPGNVPYTK